MEGVRVRPFEFFPLDWDSKFFGVKSARVILNESLCKECRKDLKEKMKDYEFVTIDNLNNDPYNNSWLGQETGAILCDVNVQFTKDIKDITHITEVGEITRACPYKKDIVELARKSFYYSRFFNDPYLDGDKKKKIYVHWVESSFYNPDKYFITIKRKRSIAGFLLFSMDKASFTAVIELIAVGKPYRGQNIGKALISTMERYLKAKKITRVRVGTQVDNIGAINFYTKLGFSYSSCKSVYHYWNTKENRK